MLTSDEGLRLIKESEGFREKVYDDPGPGVVLTIGYGHLLTDSEKRTGYINPSGFAWRDGLSEYKATQVLRDDVREAEDVIHDLVKVPLAQCQFDALVSFVFNVGRGQFARSTLLRKLNTEDYNAVPTELMRWVNDGGVRLPGLVKRREAEAKLFTQGFNCDKVPIEV